MIEMTSAAMIWILGGVLAIGGDDRGADCRPNAGRFAWRKSAAVRRQDQRACRQSRDSGAWTRCHRITFRAPYRTLALANASKDTRGDPREKEAAEAGRKQLQATLTGIAIAGGVIMLIVGIIAGDGHDRCR